MKKRLFIMALSVLLVSALQCKASVSVKGKLLAGTSKVSITPAKLDKPLHDSVYARSLILEVDGRRIAFVSMDLGGYNDETTAQICREKFNLQQIMFSSSHTHSGPSSNAENMQFFRRQIVEALDQASRNMFEAKISAGRRAFPQLTFNRLIIREDGHARESWFADDHYAYENPDRIPFGPVDNEVSVIKITDKNDKTKVVMMNYACHADLMCFNYELSADFPGAACGMVEKAFDGANCLFMQGAAGNQESLMLSYRRTGPNDPFPAEYDKMYRFGELLSYEAIKLTKSLDCDSSQTELGIVTDSLKFTGRYDKSYDYNVYLNTIIINRDIVIATSPGELFIQLQLQWKKDMEEAVKTPILFGYTWSNGQWQGYTPDVRSAALGGYGADENPNLVEIGAGEKIITKHLENYYKLCGLTRMAPPTIAKTPKPEKTK